MAGVFFTNISSIPNEMCIRDRGYWVRYFRSGKKLKDYYSSFCGVPLAGATLPVVSFLLLGLYGLSLIHI